MLTREDIKQWLKKIGKDRFWLAERCFVIKKTVDNWLSAGKPIPDAKLAFIKVLMAEHPCEGATSTTRPPRVQTMVLQFSADEWADIEEYQRLHPESDIAALSEQFVLNMANKLRDGTLHD